MRHETITAVDRLLRRLWSSQSVGLGSRRTRPRRNDVRKGVRRLSFAEAKPEYDRPKPRWRVGPKGWNAPKLRPILARPEVAKRHMGCRQSRPMAQESGSVQSSQH